MHRFFYDGGRYAHLSATCKGFRGFIYRILDLVDPKNPVEVGRWWMPGPVDGGLRGGKNPIVATTLNWLCSTAPSCTVPRIPRATWPTSATAAPAW